MAKSSKATSATSGEGVANAKGVALLVSLSNDTQAGVWAFVSMLGKGNWSVSTIQATIAQARKESPLTLKELTATKAQDLKAVYAITQAFPEIAETDTFANAFRVANGYRLAHGAEAALGMITDAALGWETIKKNKPSTSRKARPASAVVLEGQAVDGDIYAMIYDYAQALTPADRMTFAKQLLDLAKVIKVMDTVTA